MAVVRARSTRQVGRYQLVYELGQAYVGPLWAARAEGADGTSQLAILRLMALTGLDADTRVRLLEAAWQAMEVRHAHVAAVADVVASDGELAVISDYVEGLPLRSLQGIASVRKKPVPLPVALRIIADLVDGAAALHDATVELGVDAVPLYGGLSADCLFVGADGSCRILDVGVASVAGSILALSRHAERAAYSAPEQLGTPPQVDARTDVFAIGVLAWELLSNRRLFLGSDAAVVQKVLSGKIPGLDEVKRRGEPDVPTEVVAAVARALDRSPDARFQTAAELADALSPAADAVAPREALASYVREVADGALARLRDGLRDGKSGPRVAAAPRVGGPRAIIAPPREKLVDPAPAADHATTAHGASPREELGAMRPAPQPYRSPLAAARPANVAAPGAAPAGGGAAASGPARGKPTLPQRAPVARAAEAAPTPAFTSLAPGIAVTRKRQPTMIGIAPPAPVSALHSPAPAEKKSGSPEEARPDESLPPPAFATEPEPLSAGAIESLPPRDPDEEPTGQYDAHALLSHVEAMERQRESVRPPALAEHATAAPPPIIGGFAVARVLPSIFPPPGDLPVPPPVPAATPTAPPPPAPPPPPEDGGWLDDPAPSAPSASPFGDFSGSFAPSSIAPSSIAPSSIAPTARRTDRLQPTPKPSSPPPAYLPSQIPPPLMHDPRAGRATARPAGPRSVGRPARGSRVLVGVAVSAGLVIVSAAVAVLLLRGPEPHETGAHPAAPPAPLAQAEPPPAMPAAPDPALAAPAMQAEAPTASPSASPSASPAAAPTEPEASAAATPTAAIQAPVPAVTAPRAAVTRPKGTPTPRKAAPPKKKRFVPSDI